MEPAHIPQMIAYCINATFPLGLLRLICKNKIISKISSNIAVNNWCANGSLSTLNIFDNTGIYRMRSKILIATTPIARVIKFFHWRFELILSLPLDFIKFIARKPYKTLAQRHFYINRLPMDVSNPFFWFPIIHIPAIPERIEHGQRIACSCQGSLQRRFAHASYLHFTTMLLPPSTRPAMFPCTLHGVFSIALSYFVNRA